MGSFLAKHRKDFGLGSALIGLLSFRSMLWKIHQTRNTFNFPYEALVLTLIGWACLFIYGISAPHPLKKPSPWILGSIYFFIFGYILYVKMITDTKKLKNNISPKTANLDN